MAIWPFGRRQPTDYTELRLALIERRISGDSISGAGAIEACAGFWARQFAAANVTASTPICERCVTRSMMYMVGRDLLLTGESVWLITSRFRRLWLSPVDQWDIDGTYDPETWRYRVTAPGPNTPQTSTEPQDMVLHFRINATATRPWEGNSPLAIGEARVAEALNRYLNSELYKLNRQIVHAPGFMGSVDRFSEMLQEQDQREEQAEGRNQLTPPSTMRAEDVKVVHTGPNVGLPDVQLGSRLDSAICGAAGVAPGLILPNTAGGTAMREDLRRTVATTIVPVVGLAQEELRAKLDQTIELDAGAPVREADSASRSRAFQSYRAGGMTIEDAALNAGVTLESDYSGMPAPGEQLAGLEPDDDEDEDE